MRCAGVAAPHRLPGGLRRTLTPAAWTAAVTCAPASLLLQEESADEHGVDAGGVEAADGVARRADQRLAEQVERGVVEHRQAGGFAGGVQQLPVERVLVAIDGVDADQVAGQDGGGEALAVLGPHAAHGGEVARVGAHLEVLRGQFGRHRRGELAERLAVLDEDVQVLGGVGVERRGQNAAIAERARRRTPCGRASRRRSCCRSTAPRRYRSPRRS